MSRVDPCLDVHAVDHPVGAGVGDVGRLEVGLVETVVLSV